MLLASFYRPPNSNLETTLQFCYSLNKVFEESAPVYPQVITGGDFNLPGIEWETMSLVAHSDVLISQTLIDCVQQNNLSQLAKCPTRGQNVLDLLLTSNPNILSNEFRTPSPNYDHDGVFFYLLLKPKISKKPE